MTKVQPKGEAEYLAQFAEAGDVDALRMYWMGWLSSRAKLLIKQTRAVLKQPNAAREVARLLVEEETRFRDEDARYAAALDRARSVRAAHRAMVREGLRPADVLVPLSSLRGASLDRSPGDRSARRLLAGEGHPDVDGFDPCNPSGGA